ncbi:MAG: homogentisate 1,2-dioxygenase [Gammaproteobacteria bacterium]|nr:homogentisate 1,2-dioxygenase [Gammaproteobacteria bacterium]
MTNHGFGNFLCSEAIENTLPKYQNSPQHLPKGLFAEQINGTAFSKPRHQNLFSWVYRLQPSAALHHRPYHLSSYQIQEPLCPELAPNPLRWASIKTNTKTFQHIATSGKDKHFYLLDLKKNLEHQYFINHDGDFLILPYEGEVLVKTELGQLELSPQELLLIPRGIGFTLDLQSTHFKAYVLENQGQAFHLPELGLIGANGLANPRHFIYPHASYDKHIQPGKLYAKFQGKIWEKSIKRSIFNVVAWQGKYAPYKYDLNLFNTVNTVSFDHLDPSIFTTLTSDSAISGVASLDVVIFPKRWMVALNTFRLPYFHRNVMSELMGLIQGTYDAKKTGFEVGGFSIHNQMVAHGPDYSCWQQEVERVDKPVYLDNTLAFMFESNEMWHPTLSAMNLKELDHQYADVWEGFPSG